jgi:hypothetical protein
MHPIQKSGSNAFMEKKLPLTRNTTAKSEAVQPSATAQRRPPNSRVIAPVSATVPAPARAGSKRIAKSESPNSTRLNRISKADNGGRST